MYDLPALSAEIKRRIDAQSASEVDEPRWHLGASEIGEECLRRVWYKYRWIKHEEFSGAMRRLFKRGHSEEPRIVALLRSIGCVVHEVDPSTGKQWLRSLLHGHYGGSSDGLATLPFDEIPLPVKLECKTHNRKSFNDLVNHGVKKSKPKHFIQMCVYGKFHSVDIGLYIAVCKDTDEIHVELVSLDSDVADKAERTAEVIINAKSPPDRISNNSSFYKCKSCFLRGVCHLGEPIARNCRSCKFASPTAGGNAEWTCAKWNAVIPREHAPNGCAEWSAIV